jgi:hypothetical protein
VDDVDAIGAIAFCGDGASLWRIRIAHVYRAIVGDAALPHAGDVVPR